MKLLAYSVGGLLGVAAVVLFIIGIWTNDVRYGGTAFVLVVTGFAACAGGSFLPVPDKGGR